MFSSEIANEEAVAASGLVHRVHLPQDFRPGLPLAVMVHGRAGNCSVMWPFAKVFKSLSPLVIVAPEAFIADELGGFSWAHVSAKTREESARSRATKEEIILACDKLEHFLMVAAKLYQTQSDNIIGIGFSQGGAVLSSLALLRPGLLGGVGMLASFVPKVVFEEDLIDSQIQSAEVALPPFFWAHGTKDDVIEIEKARSSRDRLIGAGANVEWHEEEVGHKIGTAGLRALEAWVEKRGASF